MKKLLTAMVLALAVFTGGAGAAQADSHTAAVLGIAHQANGQICNPACWVQAAKVDANRGEIVFSGYSSTTLRNCNGYNYNFGTFFPLLNCTPVNPSFIVNWSCILPNCPTYRISVWIRQACPTGGGFNYSDTKTVTLGDGTNDAGTFTTIDRGCQPQVPAGMTPNPASPAPVSNHGCIWPDNQKRPCTSPRG